MPKHKIKPENISAKELKQIITPEVIQQIFLGYFTIEWVASTTGVDLTEIRKAVNAYSIQNKNLNLRSRCKQALFVPFSQSISLANETQDIFLNK